MHAAAKKVHSELASVRTAWSAVITGGLFTCGASDELASGKGPNALQYTASQERTLLKKGSVPLAALDSELVHKLDAAGWNLRPAPAPNPQSPAAATYVGRRSGLDVRLLEINDSRGLGAVVSIDISASCFDTASSSAAIKLMNGSRDDISEPRPSVSG